MRKAIEHLTKADAELAGVIERVGECRMQYYDPGFASLASSIIYQQLSGRVAAVIEARVAAAMPEGELTPEGVMGLEVERLRACGLSGQKTKYLRHLAECTLAGEVDFGCVRGLTDEEVIGHLTRVKGVGVWTAHMFLMFALRRPDVLPVGDLGIRMAMKKLYRMRALPKPARMEKVAARWRPWRSVACWYLWRSLEEGNE